MCVVANSFLFLGAFTAKLNFTLQNPDGQKMPDSTALVDLGIDSLVAVEVRSWFMQELGVDMPVLKVLGGATIADLVDDAVSKLPEEFLAKLGEAGDAVNTDSDAPRLDSDSASTSDSDPSSSARDTKASSSSASSEVGDGLKSEVSAVAPHAGEKKAAVQVSVTEIPVEEVPVLTR